MVKQYNVIEAKPYKEKWETKRAPGKFFQTFFLTLEEVEESVMINRAAESPVLHGLVWLELETVPGKSYLKGTKKDAPQGAPIHGQTQIPMNGAEDPGKSWGQAIQAAATLMTTDHFKPMLAGDPKDPGEPGGVRALESLARDIYMLGVPDVVAIAEAKKAEEDTIVTDVPDGDINLDDIPF